MAAAAAAGVRYLDGCVRLLGLSRREAGAYFIGPDGLRPRVYTDI